MKEIMVQALVEKLKKVGYYANPNLALDMKVIFESEAKFEGVKTIGLEGLPGVGKTFLPKSLTKVYEMEFISYTCDKKTGFEQLVEDFNVPAMVAKDAVKSVTPGVLTRAIRLAQDGKKVILVLDEFDKTAPDADFQLLEFLQSGSLTSPTYGELKIDEDKLSNLTVFIAKNNERDLHEALMRRCLKFFEVEAPNVATVKEIVEDSIDEVTPESLKMVIGMYSLILKDKEAYRKIATIQEVKNALIEDKILLNWGVNHDKRVENFINHLTKFEEDRALLKSRIGFIDKVEEQPEETVEHLQLNTSNAFSYGQDAMMDSLKERIVQLEKLITGSNTEYVLKGIEDFEQNPAILDASKDAVDSLSFLGKLNQEDVQTYDSLPKKVLEKIALKLSKNSSKLDIQNKIILGEYQIHDSNVLSQVITNLKRQFPIEKITKDGVVLYQEGDYEISLVHLWEEENKKLRLFLISNKVVLPNAVIYNSLKTIPGEISKYKFKEINANLISEIGIEDYKKNLDYIFDVSEDKKEIIGKNGNVDTGYSWLEEDELALIKFKGKNVSVKEVLKAIPIKTEEEKAQSPFGESRCKIMSIKELFDYSVKLQTYDFGRNSVEMLEQFKTKEIGGDKYSLFAKEKGQSTIYYGVSKMSNRFYDDLVKYSQTKTIEELKKEYTMLSLDSDKDYRLYKIDMSDDERNSEYQRFRLGHNTFEKFVAENRLVTLDEKINLVAERLNSQKQ